jgi:hypothetical protein
MKRIVLIIGFCASALMAQTPGVECDHVACSSRTHG